MQIIVTLAIVIFLTFLYWNIIDIHRCRKELNGIKAHFIKHADLYEIRSEIETLKIDCLELQKELIVKRKKPIPKCRPKNAEQKTKAVVLQRTNLSD